MSSVGFNSVEDYIPQDAPSHVSASTVARWLGVSPKTVQLWTDRGLLPRPRRLGLRKLWYDTEAVRAALQRMLQGTAESAGGAGQA